MFPRSKRPVSKARYSCRASAPKATAKATMDAHTAPSGLRTRRQYEVAERPVLDPHEERVELDEESEGSDERGEAVADGRRPAPVEVSLIDVAMVEPRDREGPPGAPVDPQAASGARLEQGAARIPADVPSPLVASAVELRVGRHRDRNETAGPYDAGDLSQRRAVVLEVFQHLPQNGRIEFPLPERQRPGVGADHLPRDPVPQDGDGRRRGLDAGDVEAEPLGARG